MLRFLRTYWSLICTYYLSFIEGLPNIYMHQTCATKNKGLSACKLINLYKNNVFIACNIQHAKCWEKPNINGYSVTIICHLKLTFRMLQTENRAIEDPPSVCHFQSKHIWHAIKAPNYLSLFYRTNLIFPKCQLFPLCFKRFPPSCSHALFSFLPSLVYALPLPWLPLIPLSLNQNLTLWGLAKLPTCLGDFFDLIQMIVYLVYSIVLRV